MKSRTTIYLGVFAGCLLASLVALYYVQRPYSPQNIAGRIAENLEEELVHVNEEADNLVVKLRNDPKATLPVFDQFSFYVFSRNQLLAWTDNNFVPTAASVADTFHIKLIKSGSSDYLAKKWRINNQRHLVAVIPLFRKYNITNDYLKADWNKQVFPRGNISILDANATLGIPVCAEGSCPFKISFIPEELGADKSVRITALVLSALTLIAFMLLFFDRLKKFNYPDVEFLVLGVWLLGLRILMLTLGFPAALLPGDLFNPQVFASSSLNASLGDLLLNQLALFIICIFLFKNLFHFRLIQFLQRHTVSAWILSVLSGVCVLLAILFPFIVIQTLYNNSFIDLDLSESLRFDGLRIAALIAVLFAGVCSFLFSHVFIRLLIGDGNKLRILITFLIAVFLFAGFNYLTDQLYASSLLLGLIYFAVVFGLKLYSSLQRLSFTTFTYLFVTIVFISANGAFGIHHFNREEKIVNQFRFARNFLIDRDYFGEYLLRELSTKIASDMFIQTRVATPFLTKDAVRQKIRQVFLPSYFNKYDVEIFVFNSFGESVDYHSDISLSSLQKAYDQEAFKTDYEGVYFVSSPAADVTQKYLVVVPIERLRTTVGYVVLELSLKKIIPENVYPELLVDNRFLQFYRAQEISYAVFANNKLSYSSGSYNYALFNHAWLGYPELHTQGITKGGYNHIAEEDDFGRVAVVSSRSASLAQVLANFSFLLVLGLITILAFIGIQGFVNYTTGHTIYFSARIQLFLNLAFFVPLIIVSVMTLRVTTRSSQNQINEEYLNKTKKFSEQIAVELNARLASGTLSATGFESKLVDLAQLTNLDANVYRASGTLLASSQPLIFENNLISNYISATAFNKIKSGNNLFIETERVGTLEYFIAYAALRAPSSGALIGILGIPFFQSVYSLEKVQINILANILNIFSLIFIVLVALSYVITQWLTFPLAFITQSLRKTSLTKINQPLVWKSDDEIGLMVKEYNQMLYKLSESKAELEQTQRERAWREIAQQVAHEIKNPLTPMKLKLQQLERSVQAGTHEVEKIRKAISSLLIQVNTLDEIASSFSLFAKMPEPVLKPFELVQSLKRIADLHSHSGNLVLETHLKELFVNGDEQLLGRTFSNIILNAFQAEKPGQPVQVVIRLDRVKHKALLSFQDNGKGIESEVAERIFIPHFTTKKSGSGLGLAIAKQAIEQMRGRIWFETYPGRGTIFFIELPVYHN